MKKKDISFLLSTKVSICSSSYMQQKEDLEQYETLKLTLIRIL